MKSWPRLHRARLRMAESAHRILEQQLRIATLRADGEDTTAAVRLLDELKTIHRLLIEQVCEEQARALSSDAD